VLIVVCGVIRIQDGNISEIVNDIKNREGSVYYDSNKKNKSGKLVISGFITILAWVVLSFF